MVYIKLMNYLLIKRLGTLAALILFSIIFAACGTIATDESGKPVVYTPEEAGDISTLDYIPQLKKDKKGKLIPYKASLNPYLKKKGAIEKTTIELFIQAKRAYDMDDYDSSEHFLNKLLDVNKNLSGPWVLLGDIALKRNKATLAKEQFSRAITVNENNVNAYIRLAKAERMLGNFAQAKNTYTAVLKVWKDFPEAHLNLGVLYDLYLNDNIKAQKHIEAYQFLTDGRNQDVAAWLLEIQSRTGMAIELNVQQDTGSTIRPIS